MKAINMLAIGLAALAGVPMAAYAQEAAPKTKLQAFVMIGKKTARVPVAQAEGKGKFIFLSGDNLDQQMKMDVEKCGLFKLVTPADYAAAADDYRAGELAEARKKLAAVKSKYAEYVGLPGNPATEAAQLELECAIRMQDWAAVKALADGFPHPDYLSEDEQAEIAVAKILGNIPGELEAQTEAIKALLETPAGKKLGIEQYGWLRYALARAYEAKIPADALGATVSAEQAAGLVKAVDNYCQAALCTHGTHMEIPLDAMQRAMCLLWAAPGVKDYAAANPEVDAKVWNAAPVNYKDAVVLAQLLKTVYTNDAAAALPQKALIDELSKYYYNAEKDRAKKD